MSNYVLFSLEKSNIPEPSSDLPLTEFTLKGFVVLPHVRVVLALFSKLQVADVALPDPEVQILIRPSVNISPVGILLEAVHLYEVHPQSAQPLVHVVVLWAVLAILAKADHLKIGGHTSQSPMANHMVLPLVDVLETQELTLAAFQLTDLTKEKKNHSCKVVSEQTSSASGPSKSSLSSSILGAGSSVILTHLTGSATGLACLYSANM